MDCHRIPELSYSDWSLSIHEKVVAKRTPISGSIELTVRCNNNCVHCYCSKPVNDHEELERELSTEEIFRIVDEITDTGCLWLVITGGEPLLRPDFKDIFLYAKRKGLLITLFTNGTLINDEISNFLSEWRPFLIEVTLYGMTKGTYEKITGVPGSFRRCMDGIDRLVKKRLPLKLKTMAMKINLHELRDMQQYAESLGLEFRFDPLLNARLDGGKSPTHYRLSPDDVVRLDIADEKRFKQWLDFCEKQIGPPSSDRLYSCSAGLNSFHIDPYGNLNICIMARTPSYDLKRGSFDEGWHKFIKGLRDLTFSKKTPCLSCSLMSLCGQCPGWARLEHGDDETVVEYLCAIAHKRAEMFGAKGQADITL